MGTDVAPSGPMLDAKPVAIPKDERLDPIRSAEEAGLRYVRDDEAGIARRKHGKGFRYVDAAGRPVREAKTLARIRALVIPPAWIMVWICADADGHVQATGRDARGRKQYRYHAEFRAVREETKYERIFDFAAALPRLRAQLALDLARTEHTREKVLAAAVALLDATHIRVGNETYARLNRSFGLTTLRKRHARVRGDVMELSFRGKSGVPRNVRVVDRRIAAVLRRCQGLRGEQLFGYRTPSGEVGTIDATDVNAYIRAHTSDDFTAKDFRTWAGTVIATLELAERGRPGSMTEAKRLAREAIVRTAARLGNTPAVCRKCYVHPAVLDAHAQGLVLSRVRVPRVRDHGLRADERAVLGFLARLTDRAMPRLRRAGPTSARAAAA